LRGRSRGRGRRTSVYIDRFQESGYVIVRVDSCLDAGWLYWVVARKLGQQSTRLLINDVRNMTFLAFLVSEDALSGTACGATVLVTMTVVNGLLQGTVIPTIDEIGVVPVPSRIAERVDKWLCRVLRLVTVLVKVARGPVHLQENARKSNREFGVFASS
jgi:hypothetical protein